MISSDEDFRHDLEVVDYVTIEDPDGYRGAEVAATLYAGTCQAYDTPRNDPSITAIDVTVPEGSTWATCPACGGQIRMDIQ